MSFERSNIRDMEGYVPGEQPDGDEVIKLNTNENPYPPGPAVKRALSSIDPARLRRYPPPTALPLRQTLSSLHKVDPANIVITNGGDELLRLLLATFVEPGETVATAAPSYSLYNVLAAAHGCTLREYPLQEDWRLDPDMADALNAMQAKLCFVVNPNAPSGVLNAVSDIEDLLRSFKGVVVLDEAYVDFVDPGLQYNCIPLIRQYDNLVILRTFSKGYSLAGLRMAYGIGARSLIDPMQTKTKDSYNTDYIAQRLANAAASDQAYAADTWEKVRTERRRLFVELQALGFSCPPSQSNFLLARVPKGIDANQLYQRLKQSGILVRYFNLPGLEQSLRITVGTPDENNKLLTALKSRLSAR